MATYTQNMALTSGSTLTGSHLLTDINATRIIDAHRILFGMAPASTPQQVWTRIVETMFDTMKTRTINHERAAQEAAISINPLA